jgi:hypothetical protein
MAAVVALKIAAVAPAATLTEAGTVRVELLSESETLAPAGAALFKVTVQALAELDPRLPGVHAREDTSTGATRLTLELAELPLYVAVTVAL